MSSPSHGPAIDSALGGARPASRTRDTPTRCPIITIGAANGERIVEESRSFWHPHGEVEAWVPAGIAYMVCGDELSRRLAWDFQEGRKEAAEQIFAWLEIGRIRARCNACDFNLDEGFAADRQRFIKEHDEKGISFNREAVASGALEDHLDVPDQRVFSGPCVLPAVFWDFCRPGPYPVNWATGQFFWDRGAGGVATGVEFALGELPCAEAVRAFMATSTPAASLPKPSRKGGRPPSEAWPAFCAELAAYLLEHPEAANGPGAIARISRNVLDRLMESQDIEMGDTQAKAAARAVVDRLGNRARD